VDADADAEAAGAEALVEWWWLGGAALASTTLTSTTSATPMAARTMLAFRPRFGRRDQKSLMWASLCK
jgi:hypothetical protein